MSGRNSSNTSEKKKIVLQWGQIVLGLLVFALGVHLTIFANIGLGPWDCLAMGLSLHIPLNYGLSVTLISILVLIIDLLMRERIGYGTIIDALLTGNFTEMFNQLNPFPENQNSGIGVLLMLAGFVFMAWGMYVYMSAEQCCGPRDALLVGIGKRISRVPIGVVEILLLALVLSGGWLLGGPVGIGTLVSVFGMGLVMQMVYSTIHFDPRHLVHRDVMEISEKLIR